MIQSTRLCSVPHCLIRRMRWGERGTALVEFALVLPLLLVLVMGIIDFGRAFQTVVTLTNAAREGARLGATGASASDIQSRVVSTAGVPISAGNVTVTNAQGTTGQSVTVRVNYTFQLITPLGPLVRMLGGSSINNTIPLSATADMRLE
jgi:Flp pilus assembly protein TadG